MPIRLLGWTLAFAGLAGGLQAQGTSATDILAAIMLPKAAADVRSEGVPAGNVSGILDILRKKGVPPTDARNVLLTERDVARNRGPVDNFGAVVQSKLDRGLRGRDLAEAIRAEHGLPPKAGDKKPAKAEKAEKPKGSDKKPTTKPKPKPKPNAKPKPAAKGKPTAEPTPNPMGH